MTKRKRMALKSEDMPDEVYDILNEKASKRSLTAYIIELVEESLKEEKLFRKLDVIESKLDSIGSQDLVVKVKDDEECADSMEENELSEGVIIEVENVIGGIDEDDEFENDF